MLTEKARSAIYAVAVAAIAVAVAFRWVDEDQAKALGDLAKASGALAAVTAWWHRPTKQARKAARTRIGDS